MDRVLFKKNGYIATLYLETGKVYFRRPDSDTEITDGLNAALRTAKELQYKCVVKMDKLNEDERWEDFRFEFFMDENDAAVYIDDISDLNNSISPPIYCTLVLVP